MVKDKLFWVFVSLGVLLACGVVAEAVNVLGFSFGIFLLSLALVAFAVTNWVATANEFRTRTYALCRQCRRIHKIGHCDQGRKTK